MCSLSGSGAEGTDGDLQDAIRAHKGLTGPGDTTKATGGGPSTIEARRSRPSPAASTTAGDDPSFDLERGPPAVRQLDDRVGFQAVAVGAIDAPSVFDLVLRLVASVTH